MEMIKGNAVQGEVVSIIEITPDTVEEEIIGSRKSEAMPPIVAAPSLAVTAYAVNNFWCRIFKKRFTPSDNYICDGKDYSSHKKIHMLRARSHDGKHYTLNEYQRELFISTLYRRMDQKGLLRSDTQPGVSFHGSTICVFCPNIVTLEATYGLLSPLDPMIQFYSFTLEFVAKGFPFLPRFWTLDGMHADPDQKKLETELEAYLHENAGTLGKTRAVWATTYEVRGFESDPVFSGELVILTEASTIEGDDAPPPFRGSKPERCSSTSKKCRDFWSLAPKPATSVVTSSSSSS